MALIADERGQARGPRVRQRLFVRRGDLVHLGAHVRALADRAVGDAQREVVAGRFEDGQCLGNERVQLAGGVGRLHLDSVRGLVDPPAQLADPVAGRGGARHDRPSAAQSLVPLPVPRERVDEVGLEAEVELPGRQEVGRALQEAGRAAEVGPRQRTATGRGEALAGRVGEPVGHALPELQPKAHCLLEVVADQLVQLDGRRVRFEPIRKPLVQVGPARLR